ncbi:MAG: HD domain-containing protein [Actinobacteria bacterium]|nr:HD domain-containing protein [Actinomycetota bacterium]
MIIKKDQFISQLEVGIPVDSVFIVSRKLIKKKKNGEDFCSVTLQDKDGTIEGVLWTEAYCRSSEFAEGDLVRIKGEVKEYRGSRQLVVEDLKAVHDEEGIDFSDYVMTTGKDIEEMFSQITAFIDSIKNIHLKKLFALFTEDPQFVDNFKNATAAIQYHHAYRGGLLEHTLAVTRVCDALAAIYENLNRDLLISGAMLHDIGKIREYDSRINMKVTDEGKLLGHITIGYGWVLEKIEQIEGFPEDLKNRLLHIILSHHGHREFGSPKRPKILEAFVVYHVDHMDADIGGFSRILESNTGDNDWSEYMRNFERSVYIKRLETGEEDSEDYGGPFFYPDKKPQKKSKESPPGPEQEGLF